MSFLRYEIIGNFFQKNNFDCKYSITIDPNFFFKFNFWGIHSAVAKIIATATLATYILGFNIFFAKYYVNVSNTFLGVLVSNDLGSSIPLQIK